MVNKKASSRFNLITLGLLCLLFLTVIVKQAGFKTALTTIKGILISDTNRFFLYRIRPGGRVGESLMNYPAAELRGISNKFLSQEFVTAQQAARYYVTIKLAEGKSFPVAQK